MGFEGGLVGEYEPKFKHLQISDLQRLASLQYDIKYPLSFKIDRDLQLPDQNALLWRITN